MDWKKIIIIALDAVIGVYLVLVMMSFIRPDETEDICTDIHINICKESEEGFLNEKDIRKILDKAKLSLLSQPMKLINTRQIEEILQGNDLIENAECYKALDGMLCINIKQRIPIVRVMAENGDDYYVDSHHEVMPHSNYSCDLLIATGHINKQYASKVLAPLAATILKDNFWRNQVEQINILEDYSVELVPRVGEHIVYLGQPTKVATKLERLRKFYRYGLNEAGWNRYSRISVEFDNQIICKKNKVKKAQIW